MKLSTILIKEVFGQINEKLLDSEFKENVIHVLTKVLSEKENISTFELETLNIELLDCINREEKVKDAYEGGVYSLSEIKARLIKLRKMKEIIKEEIQSITNELKNGGATTSIRWMKAYNLTIEEINKNVQPIQFRNFLKEIIEEIIVSKGEPTKIIYIN